MSSYIPVSGREQGTCGSLKVFLGYAAGVGKTYRMLEEAQQLQRQGNEIVVGYFEPHGRKDTMAKMEGLEFIPRRKLAYRGSTFEEMDTPAILRRHPAICVVDELAHTNVPGSERQKRWEDAQVLLDEGINVLTNMNIQHLESLNDQVFQISGIRVQETVPDWFVKGADEVVMVDATTGALLNRLKRGNIYAPEKAQKAMENFFKESTLGALRELALRQTAHELDLREKESASVSDGSGIEVKEGQPAIRPSAEAHDKILICITPETSTAMLIRRGRRMADYLDADCFAVYVCNTDFSRLPGEKRDPIEKHLNFARNLHIETRVLEGIDPAQTIIDFARRNQITQILLARPQRYTWWDQVLRTNPILQIVQKATDMRVIIVAERKRLQ